VAVYRLTLNVLHLKATAIKHEIDDKNDDNLLLGIRRVTPTVRPSMGRIRIDQEILSKSFTITPIQDEDVYYDR